MFPAIIHIVIALGLAAMGLQLWWVVERVFGTTPCVCHPAEYSVDNSSVSSVSSTSKGSKGVQLLDSSVWCWGDNHTNRLCRFHNLCYLPSDNEFMFLHGPDSIYVGLPSNRHDPALLDMSSVANHNTQYFNFIDAVTSEVMKNFRNNVTVFSGTSLIFRRFHPVNLMHVFHDDLLPLFYTLGALSGLMSENGNWNTGTKLVLADDSGPGPFDDLYKLFTTQEIIFKKDMHLSNSLVCFSDSYVGLLKDTTWYHYGFTKPQGPIPGKSVSYKVIRKFCHHVRLLMNTSQGLDVADGRTIVLLTRKYNRLILNEVELTVALAQHLRVKVVSVGLETHSLAELIAIISKASMMIGMHGSLLSLAMFLPRRALLVELFPYAVNPQHYTPYKTLASLPGMDIDYIAWQNLFEDKTVIHPHRPSQEGGIDHLSKELQTKILSSNEVPQHLCCSDPEWLFRIYQDTIVDVQAVMSLILKSQEYQVSIKSFTESIDLKQALVPAQVRNIKCQSGTQHEMPSLLISWQSPANLEFLLYSHVKYEVWIQEDGKDDYTAWMLTKFEHSFTAGILPSTSYLVWVRCIVDDDSIGQFNTYPVSCTTPG